MDFSRTLRTLDAGDRTAGAWTVAGLALLLAAWAGWFTMSHVALYASTSSARLEVDRENYPVDVVLGGRVTAVRVAVGQVVHAGDALVEFEAASDRLARREQQSRLAPASSQAALLREELSAQERALEDDRHAAEAASAQADAESRRAQAAAAFAAEESRRVDELQRRSLVSEMEALRARNVAAERQNDAASAEAASHRAVREAETRTQDRLSQIARLKHDIAAIDGTRAQAMAASDTLGYNIEQRVVRAPIDGTVAEVTTLTRGSVVAAGARICTVVPSGQLRVVAYFPPATALGRVRQGQTATVRLEGFPWTEYGAPSARVSSVSGEARDGRIRVELALDGTPAAIPLQHGLPAQVDIEVDRVSPFALVMRSIGARTRLAAADTP